MEEMTATQACLNMEGDFPAQGSAEEKMKFLVKYAILAPSVRNSQPWNFKIGKDEIQLHLDRSRSKRTSDPQLRELIISCGAALQHLRVAARRFGLNLNVETFPDGAEGVLAVIRLGTKKPADENDAIMFYAIHKWLNTPQPFRAKKKIPSALLEEFQELATTDKTWLYVAKGSAGRDTLAGLIAEGDLTLKKSQEQKPGKTEAAAQLSRRRKDKGGIMKMDVGKGAGHIASYIGSFLSRPFAGKSEISKSQKALSESEPVLVVLGTHEDTPEAWLAAGQTLASILLRGLSVGVRASFLNQPVQLPELRERLKADLKLSGHPQMLLRMGFPEQAQLRSSATATGVREQYL